MRDIRRIFLTHSSADAPLTIDLRNQLKKHARTRLDIEVLVDLKTLRPGQPWPIQLHEMMAYCDAGVLLLTRSAVESAWVLKEATILAWRAALDDNFRLFVVQMPDVEDTDLRGAKFDPLMLNYMQRIRAHSPVVIAKSIIEQLASLSVRATWSRVKTPLDMLVSDLSILLKRVDPDRLAEMRGRLKLPPPLWQPSRDRQSRDAELVARCLLRGKLGTYDGVEELIDDLVRVTAAETVEKIYRDVAPYWVPVEAAGCLPALGRKIPQRSAVLIGNCIEYSTLMYVLRAHPATYAVEMIDIANINPSNIVAHVTSEISKWYRARRKGVLGADVKYELKNIKNKFYFYVILHILPSTDEIRTIVDEFPTIRFVFGVKRDPETEDEGEQIYLTVDRDIEERQYQAHSDVERLLKSTMFGGT